MMNPSAEPTSIVISMNPNSGSMNQQGVVEELKVELVDRGFDVQLMTDIDEVKKASLELLKSNSLRAVVAAGGDGTVSLLANLLTPQIPIAILPLGT